MFLKWDITLSLKMFTAWFTTMYLGDFFSKKLYFTPLSIHFFDYSTRNILPSLLFSWYFFGELSRVAFHELIAVDIIINDSNFFNSSVWTCLRLKVFKISFWYIAWAMLFLLRNVRLWWQFFPEFVHILFGSILVWTSCLSMPSYACVILQTPCSEKAENQHIEIKKQN